ncbi:MAG: hypothetical protein AAGG01_18940, partial [Planctomycetota bacterium]
MGLLAGSGRASQKATFSGSSSAAFLKAASVKKLLVAAVLLAMVGMGWRVARAGGSASPELLATVAELADSVSEGGSGPAQGLAAPHVESPERGTAGARLESHDREVRGLIVTVLDQAGRPASDGHVLLTRPALGGSRPVHDVRALGTNGTVRFENAKSGEVTVEESVTQSRERVTIGNEGTLRVTLRREL